jgi:hypothetical protein
MKHTKEDKTLNRYSMQGVFKKWLAFEKLNGTAAQQQVTPHALHSFF